MRCAPLLFAAALAAPASAQEPESGAPLPPPRPAVEAHRWHGTTAALEDAARALERAAHEKSPLALALLHRLWNLNTLVERPGRVQQSLERVLAEGRADPLTLAHAGYLQSQLLRQAGRVPEAQARLQKLGYASSAQLIGAFEGAAGQGHDEPYPPEREIDLGQSYDGKAHRVRWRAIEDTAATGGFELSSLVAPAEEATVYLAIAMRSPKAQRAALRLGATDQAKAFLDGVPVLAVDARRPASVEQLSVPLNLPAGDSLLLLKSSWMGTVGRVRVRISAPSGAPLEGVELRGDAASVTAAAAAALHRPPSSAPPAAITGVTDAIDPLVRAAKGVERARVLGLRADLAAVLSLSDQRKVPSAAERDLEEAIRLDPAQPDLRFFYAHRAEPRDPTLAREQLEAALSSDPGHVPSLFKLAEMARQGGRSLEAQQLLTRALAADPAFTPARISLAAVYSDSAVDRERALKVLSEGTESSTLLTERARLARSLDDRRSAVLDLERALERDTSDIGARSTLVSMALDAHDAPRALRELDALLRAAPWELDAWLDKARLMASTDEGLAPALAVLERAGRVFPDHPSVPNLRAELLLFRGEKAQAIAELDHSLSLDPHQPLVRRHKGQLSGVRRELEDEYGLELRPLLDTPVDQDERTWGAISLAERTAVRLYENGESSRFYQVAVRLRRASLKDALRMQRIAYVPSREIVEILSAERVRPNGEVLKASSINDEGSAGKVGGMYIDRRVKTVLFDDLAEGDVLHLRYRIDSTGANIFGGFFGDIEGLQGPLPKRNVRYVAIAPKQRPLYAATVGAPPPARLEDADTMRLEWSFDRLEAIDFEPSGPPYPDVGMMVSVSTYKSWRELGRWYAGLFSEQLELDDAARDAGRRAVQGVSDEAEKIRRLYAYVVKNTRYVGIELGIHGWKPFKAAEVHRRRYGDCKDKATLLAALLRDNGVDATIALVRTSDRGRLPEDHATMWAFNHAITYVPGADLFLDGTAEFSGSHELPYLDQGAQALIVRPDGRTEWRTLPESRPEDNLNRSSYVARLARDGTLELEGREEFHGARAAQAREEFEEQESRTSRLERQLNQVFDGVHVQSLEFSDMADLEAPVHYLYKARIDRYGTEDAGRTVLPVALFQHQVASAYAAIGERKSDLYTNHAWQTQNVVRYQLPPGAQIEVLPDSATLDTPYLSLVQGVRRVPGGFETDDTVTLKAKRVPAAAYAELRRAALAVDRALARSVVIRW